MSLQYPPVMSDTAFQQIVAAQPFGSGTARIAYDVPSDGDVVVKKAIQAFPASNILEWTIWRSAAGNAALSKVLGACLAISESAQFLMMERLDDITKEDYADIPDVPVWFNDPKPIAFGKRHGVIKIRDYGLVRMDQLLVGELTFPPAFAMSARTARRFKL